MVGTINRSAMLRQWSIPWGCFSSPLYTPIFLRGTTEKVYPSLFVRLERRRGRWRMGSCGEGELRTRVSEELVPFSLHARLLRRRGILVLFPLLVSIKRDLPPPTPIPGLLADEKIPSIAFSSTTFNRLAFLQIELLTWGDLIHFWKIGFSFSFFFFLSFFFSSFFFSFCSSRFPFDLLFCQPRKSNIGGIENKTKKYLWRRKRVRRATLQNVELRVEGAEATFNPHFVCHTAPLTLCDL